MTNTTAGYREGPLQLSHAREILLLGQRSSPPIRSLLAAQNLLGTPMGCMHPAHDRDHHQSRGVSNRRDIKGRAAGILRAASHIQMEGRRPESRTI